MKKILFQSLVQGNGRDYYDRRGPVQVDYPPRGGVDRDYPPDGYDDRGYPHVNHPGGGHFTHPQQTNRNYYEDDFHSMRQRYDEDY